MSPPQRHPPKGPAPAGDATASWFTPARVLALFCACALCVYLDRGMIGSNGVNGSPRTPAGPSAAGSNSSSGSNSGSDAGGSGIQGDFGLSLFQDGLLPAAFMVGLLVSSPIFAEASKRRNALRLIGAGLAVWAVATAGCGLAPGFTVLLLCRMAVGVGEASFVALASPFIDDNAPPGRKALWLGVFYMCIPTGYALGYIYGGLVGSAWGWRAAFLLESAVMVPFAAFCLLAPPIDIRGTHDTEPSSCDGAAVEQAGAEAGEHVLLTGPGGTNGSSSSSDNAHAHESSQGLKGWAAAVAGDLKQLIRHPVYVLTVLGMVGYTAVLGAFAFYGPKAGREVFGIKPQTADLTFGAITVATGIVGTLAGGALLDRMGSSLRNALLLCTSGMAVGTLLVVLAFALAGSFAAFSALFAAVCMWSVPPGLRPFGMSMSVVAMHVLGDVPSPPLLGALQGALGNWRISMSLICLLLVAGAAAYSAGVVAARTAKDYRDLGLQPVDGSSRSRGSELDRSCDEGPAAAGRLSPDLPLLLSERAGYSDATLHERQD